MEYQQAVWAIDYREAAAMDGVSVVVRVYTNLREQSRRNGPAARYIEVEGQVLVSSITLRLIQLKPF